jgi:hypothetical protein
MSTIATIRSVATHFSEELKHKAKPKDEVTIAGRITECAPIDEEYIMLVLDDFVGTSRVLISLTMYEHFQSICQMGQFVIVEGYVNALMRKLHNLVETQYSIIGFDMKLLTL